MFYKWRIMYHVQQYVYDTYSFFGKPELHAYDTYNYRTVMYR